MVEGHGKAACKGIAIGRVYVYTKPELVIAQSSGDAQLEKTLFEQAKNQANQELQVMYNKIAQEFGEEEAAIMEVQQLMLEDPDFLESVEGIIDTGESAAEAVWQTGELLGATFEAIDDAYMRERAADVRDIAKRIVGILSGCNHSFHMEEEGIIVAADLSPTETISLPKDKILAFVTQKGSNNSHTAILARMMNIPALIQADIDIHSTIDGTQMIVDGYEQKFYLEPEPHIIDKMEEKKQELLEELQELEAYRGVPSVTKSGKTIQLYANIGEPSDLEYVIQGDGEGIGLMRSEFLYLGRTSFPTEEELYQAYHTVVSGMNGKKVVIRTLDIGADKQVDYFGLEEEENPALGYRGIRICLQQQDIFRTQMRAIYRASAFGQVAVMFPMIISVEEVLEIKRFCKKIQQELQEEEIPMGQVEVGVMIETPAAVLISEELASEVDFFSVGTNDLTQYTLALDRQNQKLESLYNPYHPAILRQLELVARSATKAGIWAGICGELAADEKMTDEFIRMGYSELSMSSGSILKLRKCVCQSQA